MEKKFDKIRSDVAKLEDAIVDLRNSLEDLSSSDWKYVIPEIIDDFKKLEKEFYMFKEGVSK